MARITNSLAAKNECKGDKVDFLYIISSSAVLSCKHKKTLEKLSTQTRFRILLEKITLKWNSFVANFGLRGKFELAIWLQIRD